MPGLKPGDCGSAVRSIDLMFPWGRGIRSGYLPLTRPSVLGNPYLQQGRDIFNPLDPPLSRTRKNAFKYLKNAPYQGWVGLGQ